MAEWICERCTWRNNETDLACTMCFGNRTSAKDDYVHWQWQPQANEPWIPYDQATAQQLEQAFQQGQHEVELQHGFFASRRGYKVVSIMSKPMQLNTRTGMQRSVRRMCEDDEHLFVPVPDKDGQCSICLDDFNGDSVRLSVCVDSEDSHCFHRNCIAQWVKLHNNCAYCRARV
ncbi:MAG: hypothetical protein MHM6MM_003294 [Cercozoa sp. M6MM]